MAIYFFARKRWERGPQGLVRAGDCPLIVQNYSGGLTQVQLLVAVKGELIEKMG
jgi:hypothetical protein